MTSFVETTTAEAEHAFRVLRETGTISPSATVQVYERVPGRDELIELVFPNPWKRRSRPEPRVLPFEQSRRFSPIFAAHPSITTVVHVHTPWLGAWAQAQRSLPIRYVAVQRLTLATELPVYLDRRQAEFDFILEQLAANPDLPAIVEANGGATVWGREGLLATAQLIQLLEEGAQLQALAEAIGGSRDYGPGVLAQQWARTGLLDEARTRPELAARLAR